MLAFLETPLTVLHISACLFLVLVVLIQPGKSGGLGAFGGAGAQQVFGGRGAGNILTKATWITATIFFVTSTSLAYLSSSTTDSLESKAKKTEKIGDAPTAPAAPAK
jgi:preprotein translocase subunit SecG